MRLEIQMLHNDVIDRYASADWSNPDSKRASGAYIFRPNSTAVYPVDEGAQVKCEIKVWMMIFVAFVTPYIMCRRPRW